jgi:hypothetical protein
MCCKSWFLWVGLLGLCLAAALVRTSDHARAQPPEIIMAPPHEAPAKDAVVVNNGPNVGKGDPRRPGGAHNQPKPPVVVFESKADGYGVAEDDAAQNAFKAAADKVAEHLSSKYGETFTEDRLKELPKELKDRGVVGEPTFEIKEMPYSHEKMREAFVDVRLTDQQEKELRTEARMDRQKGRMKSAGMALAGLMALLLVGGGYLRLEEATKGYYTTLLRVAALGILGAVGASLAYLWM